MSEQTKIAWCDSTINFWSGCTKVSPGCAHCYAETRDKRHMIEDVDHWGKGAPRLKHVGAVKQALAMNRRPFICDGCGMVGDIGCAPACHCTTDETKLTLIHRRRIFSLSLGDWLDNEVPIEWLAEMLDCLRRATDVTWILCTKRPENFLSQMISAMKWIENSDRPAKMDETHLWILDWTTGEKIPHNIIVLTSVENQEMADKRIPELLKIPAARRGLSLEPLLGPIDLRDISVVDWLIVGGESGTNARPCNVDWIRSLVQQGNAAGVATFVKQLGALPCWNMPNQKSVYTELLYSDKKGGDPSEWPQDLRVQQWPVGF